MSKFLQIAGGVWSFLSNKKTAIGATCLVIAQTLTGVETAWAFHAPFVDGAITFLNDWGLKITDVGIAHKIVKVLDSNAPAAPPAP